MTQISQADFYASLERQRANQGTRYYEWDESNNFVPTPNNVPAPSAPGRRPATPQPAGPAPFGLAASVIDDACNLRRLSPAAFRNASLPTAVLTNLSPSYRNFFDNAWDRLCGESPGNSEPEQPTRLWEGGQCSGVRYNVTGSFLRPLNPPQCLATQAGNTQQVVLWGPILGARIAPLSGGGRPFQVLCRGVASNSILPSPQWVSITSIGGSAGCPTGGQVTGLQVSRADGQPDNCGSPPPNYPDDRTPLPRPPRINIDVGGSPVTITPTINFNTDTGDIEIQIGDDINLTFDGVNFNFGDDNGGGTPGNTPVRPSPDDSTTDPDEPPPLPPQDEDLEEPPEPPAEVIRAALVTVTAISEYQTAINGASPDPDNFFPDLGTIKFRISADDTNSGFTNPIRVQNQRAFIPCPWDGGAFAVVGTPRPGVEWTITPIYDISGLPQP